MASPEQRVSIGRFIVAEVVLTMGVYLVWRDEMIGTPVGIVLINLGHLFIPSGRSEEEWNRPVKWKELVLIIGGLLFLVALICLANRFISKEAGEAAMPFLRHPVTLAIIWVAFTTLNYFQWKRANRHASSAPSVPERFANGEFPRPSGAYRIVIVIRWLRSFLASPPANFLQPSGLVRPHAIIRLLVELDDDHR